MNNKMDAALRCVHLNLPVFPTWGAVPRHDGHGLVCGCGSPQCRNAAKHPHRLAQRGLRDASLDEMRVRSWWEAAPTANIAITTGDIIVLDVDQRHNGYASLRKLEGRLGAMPPTLRVITGGGGEHYYFRAPKGADIRNSAGKLGEGLDVRAHGGYVIGPGSTHISGRAYEWSVDGDPDEVGLADLPEPLAREINPQTTATKAATPPSVWREMVTTRVAE